MCNGVHWCALVCMGVYRCVLVCIGVHSLVGAYFFAHCRETLHFQMTCPLASLVERREIPLSLLTHRICTQGLHMVGEPTYWSVLDNLDL